MTRCSPRHNPKSYEEYAELAETQFNRRTRARDRATGGIFGGSGLQPQHDGMVLSIPFREGAMADLYQKCQRLQLALKESAELTGMQLLRLVIPQIGLLY